MAVSQFNIDFKFAKAHYIKVYLYQAHVGLQGDQKWPGYFNIKREECHQVVKEKISALAAAIEVYNSKSKDVDDEEDDEEDADDDDDGDE